MKRRTMRRRDVPGTARFLTFCCHRRLPLFRNDAIKDHFVERLTRTAETIGVEVLAWVVMPDHVHLVVYTGSEAVSMTRFTHALKRPFAVEMLNRWRKANAPVLIRLAQDDGHRFWQTGGGFDRNVVGDELIEKIRYVHANPVRRGLAESPAEYVWSSATAYDEREDVAGQYVGPPIRLEVLPVSRGEVI